MALVDATSALGVLWTLWLYESSLLVMVAPSVKTFLYFTNLQFAQLIAACASATNLKERNACPKHQASKEFDL